MISSFGLNYASEINASVPGFTTSEIVSFLNQAQDDIVITLCEAKAWEKLEKLRTNGTFTTFVSDAYKSNTIKASITFSYFWLIETLAYLTRSELPRVSEATWVECRDFSNRSNDLHKFESNGVNKPVFETPIWYRSGDWIEVIGDSYTTITNVLTKYIAIPTPIADANVEPDVHVSYHGKIVDRAVTLALESMGNQRIASQPQIAV